MYKHILVPVDLDGSYDWEHTLPMAIGLARAHGGKLHIMTVVPEFGMSIVGQFFPGGFEKEVATKILATLKERTKEVVPEDLSVQNIVSEGSVYESIIRMSKQTTADLIVIGAHRPELRDYLLGPNAARVVRHADCSVLVVRD
jgi:nucleotide-binding universal stress UspA family protein